MILHWGLLWREKSKTTTLIKHGNNIRHGRPMNALSCTDKSPTLMHLFTSSVVAKSPWSPRDESNTSKTLSLSHNSQTWKEATNYSCGHMESNWGYIYGECRKLTFLKRSTCSEWSELPFIQPLTISNNSTAKSEDIEFYTRETHINCKYWR